MICKPIGRPAAAWPQGIASAGKPSTLIPRDSRVVAMRVSIMWAVHLDCAFADARRGERCGGREQAVDAVKQCPEVVEQRGAQALRVDVVGGRNQTALVEQCQDVGAEIAASL